MSKRERLLVGVLVVLSAISGLIYYFNNRAPSSASASVSIEGTYHPISVENPLLQVERLEKLHHVQYTGTHRNIFSETPPPHVPTAKEIAEAKMHEPPPVVAQPYIPPVTVNLKFYGYIDDPRTGARRAFFTNGEDIFIAGIGDTLDNRLRVTRIGNDTVELMEISSSRRTTLPIEQDARP